MLLFKSHQTLGRAEMLGEENLVDLWVRMPVYTLGGGELGTS